MLEKIIMLMILRRIALDEVDVISSMLEVRNFKKANARIFQRNDSQKHSIWEIYSFEIS
jgi:hypothetical protein